MYFLEVTDKMKEAFITANNQNTNNAVRQISMEFKQQIDSF
jgi:hypothetical protein